MNYLVMKEEINGVYEILPGMTTEEMKAMFFDKDALIEPAYRVYQLNSAGHRYYYIKEENGSPVFFPSVTTILDQTLPKSPYLIKWMADKGMEEAERYKEERASYGTFMHAQFERLLIERMYNLDTLKDELKSYIEANKLPESFIYHADELKKDVLAFAQFVIDYDVKPMAIEIALVHKEKGYAGMIDLPCTLTWKGERIAALVDFKSGRKGFHEDNEIQLHFYMDMWNYNFPNMPISHVFNFSPKDWRTKPTYNFKEQTNSVNAAKMEHLLAIAAIEDSKRNNTFTSVSGSIMLDSKMIDLGNNILTLTLSEVVKSRTEKDDKPQDSIDVIEANTEVRDIDENVDVRDLDEIFKEPKKEPKKAEPKKLIFDESDF